MLNNIDYETFYNRANKAFNVFAIVAGDNALIKLLRACRMKPHSVFENGFKRNALDYHWVDEFGNSLKMDKETKKIHLILNNKELKYNTQTKTDLFFGCPIEEAILNGRAALISKTPKRKRIVVIDGCDEYFRAFEIAERSTPISPLEAGLLSLKSLCTTRDTMIKGSDIYPLFTDKMKQTFREQLIV